MCIYAYRPSLPDIYTFANSLSRDPCDTCTNTEPSFESTTRYERSESLYGKCAGRNVAPLSLLTCRVTSSSSCGFMADNHVCVCVLRSEFVACVCVYVGECVCMWMCV